MNCIGSAEAKMVVSVEPYSPRTEIWLESNRVSDSILAYDMAGSTFGPPQPPTPPIQKPFSVISQIMGDLLLGSDRGCVEREDKSDIPEWTRLHFKIFRCVHAFL